MTEPEDILEIGGRRIAPAGEVAAGPRPSFSGGDSGGSGGSGGRTFLSVWYRCCHTYGRLNRNREQTAYIGRCPRCGAAVRAIIGPGGTNRRCFEAR